MLKIKWYMTITRDVTESSLKKVKITGIVTSLIPVIHLCNKRCPNWNKSNVIYSSYQFGDKTETSHES